MLLLLPSNLDHTLGGLAVRQLQSFFLFSFFLMLKLIFLISSRGIRVPPMNDASMKDKAGTNCLIV